MEDLSEIKKIVRLKEKNKDEEEAIEQDRREIKLTPFQVEIGKIEEGEANRESSTGCGKVYFVDSVRKNKGTVSKDQSKQEIGLKQVIGLNKNTYTMLVK